MIQSRTQQSRRTGGFAAFNATVLLIILSLSASLWAAEPKAAPRKISATAAQQMQALQAVKSGKTLTQKKIDSRLFLALLRQHNDIRVASLTSFRFVAPEGDNRVAVDIILSDPSGVKPVIEKLEQLGDVVRAKSYSYRRVSARVHLDDLEGIAAIPQVRRLRQAIPALKNKVNTSEGDLTHGAAEARTAYGVTGAGVKVGVLSDGVTSLASLQATGDLPPTVQVLPGQAGSGDEGSAMLEIVHDLAPGASLAFATADPDEATFAQNIRDLAAAGCNIIVDDVIYLDESPFEDGPVAQAVNDVTAAGVSYFSSAGNEGNKDDLTSGTWEGDFNPNGTPAALAGAGPVHNFGDGGQSITVTSANDDPTILMWAEHFDLDTGNASTDYDLYIMDSGLTSVVDASTDTQDGTGGDDFPIEYIADTFTGDQLVIAKFADGTTSSVPMFNLITFRGEFDPDLATSGATRGHSSAAAAFSVAATPAALSFDGVTPDGPYPGLFTAANESESFTSDGPRRIILDSTTGNELTPGNRTSTGGVVRQKPDLTAADGVSAAAPGFDPFYGTSAAAPHAAAIAALVKSSIPAITPAQLRTALISSAIDIETAGTDRDTGAGIVMAHAALQSAGAVPQALLSAGTAVPTQVAGDGDAYIENNEIWSLIVPLTNDGGAPATAISAVLTTSTAGVTINSGTSAYPDLASGATADNTTPYSFTVGSAVPCGAFIHFTLTVTLTGGSSPESFDFTLGTGQPGTPVTFSYTGPAVPIPDGTDLSGEAPGAPVVAPLVVSGVPGNIYDVKLRIDGTSCSNVAGSTTVGLDHTFVNDLRINLISPATTNVGAIQNTDGSGNNFCQTLLDDASAGPSIQSVVSANAPFTGSYTPAAPFVTFRGENPNGTWNLQAQDFFSGDTGNIRAYSLIITPAICDSPVLATNVSGTKTVSGTFYPGSTVTYTVTLTNSGGIAQADNAGNEFSDVLPASLTLVSASASSGTAVATVGTNTVTWNGALAAAGGSTTITITATVKASTTPGTTVSNQGSISFDMDGNGSNEATTVTDDPAVAGATNPTSFVVNGAVVTATKTVAGTFHSGGTVTYTVTLSNSGNVATADNPGNEMTDVLPSGLTLVSATASSGTAVATIGTNTVTWNGAIPAAGSVTITITATINSGTNGTTINNQASVSYDSDGNGTNDTTVVSDDPGVAGSGNATGFAVTGPALSATKTVAGTFTIGSNVTYTIVITNSGTAPSVDNATDEFTDVLPAGVHLVSATATSGTATTNLGTNTVSWNGGIAASGSVTITITATVQPSAAGQTVSNQGTVFYDADSNGTNETAVLTDNPGTPASGDATTFVAAGGANIPTLSTFALLMLALGLAFVALRTRLS